MEMQATNSYKRRHTNELTKPEVYDPETIRYTKATVEKETFEIREREGSTITFSGMLITGGIVGAIFGLLLSLLGIGNLRERVIDILSAGEFSYIPITSAIFCVIWGAILGCLFGLILYGLCSKVKNKLPVYAALLFIPTVLYLLLTPLTFITQFLIQALLVLAGIAIAILGIVFVWNMFFG